ncbi:MAG: hypothetical protein IJH63_03240 [Methanobrevibacter sp.]|nr:hypothetical protein [Methanobrevibacter sp.]
MVWRGDIQKHYNNVDKAYLVMGLIDDDDIQTKDGIRSAIVNETRLACECIIDWLDDEENEYSEKSSFFLKNLESGYDVCIIIDARNFIYKLLRKPLSELLNIGGSD